MTTTSEKKNGQLLGKNTLLGKYFVYRNFSSPRSFFFVASDVIIKTQQNSTKLNKIFFVELKQREIASYH